MLAVLIFSVAGAAGKPVDAHKPFIVGDLVTRNWLVGTWNGDVRTDDGKSRRWEVKRDANGTFVVDFCYACGSEKEIRISEYGRWGLSGPVYFTITEGWIREGSLMPADPRDEGLYDAYYVLEADGNTFRYKNASTGNEFTVHRGALKQ